MIAGLPQPVAAHICATNLSNLAALLETFVDDALVNDQLMTTGANRRSHRLLRNHFRKRTVDRGGSAGLRSASLPRTVKAIGSHRPDDRNDANI
jgi:hypothetical protein